MGSVTSFTSDQCDGQNFVPSGAPMWHSDDKMCTVQGSFMDCSGTNCSKSGVNTAQIMSSKMVFVDSPMCAAVPGSSSQMSSSVGGMMSRDGSKMSMGGNGVMRDPRGMRSVRDMSVMSGMSGSSGMRDMRDMSGMRDMRDSGMRDSMRLNGLRDSAEQKDMRGTVRLGDSQALGVGRVDQAASMAGSQMLKDMTMGALMMQM